MPFLGYKFIRAMILSQNKKISRLHNTALCISFAVNYILFCNVFLKLYVVW